MGTKPDILNWPDLVPICKDHDQQITLTSKEISNSFNVTNGFSHYYPMCESTFIFGDIKCVYFYFIFDEIP